MPRRLFANSDVKSCTSMSDAVFLHRTTESGPPSQGSPNVHWKQVFAVTHDVDSFFMFKPKETLMDDLELCLMLDKNEDSLAAELARLGQDRDQTEGLSNTALTENKSICEQLAAELGWGLED
ncbi:hypothetical protein Hypma_008146 [Hypsizygus marmoreus]|uniref:Uncharacterized protein n=1 Tax=Hypsizygus marmoreus TaxID=39966 RepID=A0A369JU66_HYPMA|nr:hypothetical protein Hypma_008146 [Hypsizygus marmoreus]